MTLAPARYSDRVIRLLQNPKGDIVPRRIAARELGKSRSSAVPAVLERALNDPDGLIRKWAGDSLREIQRRSQRQP